MADGSIWVGASARTDVTTSTGGTIAKFEVCNGCLQAESRGSVANFLNITGRKIACFVIFSADEFVTGFRCCAEGLQRRRFAALSTLSQNEFYQHLGPAATVRHDTRKAVAVDFSDVQPCFLQLFLTQTWVKCTSLDSSRCVVYSGIRIEAIRAASKTLEQDEWWKTWVSCGHLVVLLFINFFYINFFNGLMVSNNNYRPIIISISALPVLSKIYEKHILHLLNKFLTSHNIISNHQSGFRKIKRPLTKSSLAVMHEWSVWQHIHGYSLMITYI